MTKVAVVTGGGTGIGRAIAVALDQAGFTVAVVGRRAARLQPSTGQDLRPYPCDVTDAAQIRATVDAVVADLGRLDVLVNSAGVAPTETIDEITEDSINHTIGINLVGTMNFSLACVPALKQTQGAIINIGSTLSDRPVPRHTVYSASKGGINAFSKALAYELASDGVRVNVVSPGLVRSEIYLTTDMDEGAYETFLQERGEVYPLGRAGEAEEVAAMVRYLVSDDATWVTGAVFPIDGGHLIS